MGPKKGKKGGAGGGPGEGEEAKQGEKISEVDKEWFGIQMKSLEEKLDRRNEKLRWVNSTFGLTTDNWSLLTGGSRSGTPTSRPSTSSSGRTRRTLWPS